MKNLLIRTALLSFMTLTAGLLPAQVPQLISYQGRVGVDGVNFDGSGQFKFAFVNAAGTTTYWSNDGSSTAGSEPGTAINIPVSKGLYAVLLGDATLPHMSIVPATVFTHGDVHLRVWFSDGVNGFQQLTPDRRIAAVGYAMMADSVSDGSITTAKIADGAVTSAKLAAGVVQTANLATGAVGNAQLANSAVTINAGTGLGGGGLVSLGGAVSLSNAGVLSLTGGGGITVDAATGAITLGSSATSAGTAGAIVARDASGGFTAGTITAALNGNAATATTATDFTGMLAGDVTGTQAATAIAATTVTGKALTGFTSAAGSVSASDTLLSAISKLDGNVALKAPLASPTFTGSVTLPAGSATAAPLLLQTGTSLTTPALGALEFDGTNLFVTNNSASPTRKTVAFTDSTVTTAQIEAGSVTTAKLATGAVGSAQLASGLTLGGTTTGTFSGNLTGNVTGNVSGSAASFTGSLAGDATGTQGATEISATTITGKVITGFVSGAGTLAATDSLLTAINKLDGNTMLKAPLASPTFTGSVTLPAGTTTAAPLVMQTGTSLTAPTFGALEFDGTNVFVTNNSTSPTRKTLAFTDTPLVNAQIADGSVTASKLATGAVGSAQLAPGAAAANLESASLSGVASSGLILSALENNSALVSAGYVKVYGSVIAPDAWLSHNTGSPIARKEHTAVWTSTEMIVWGGHDSSFNYLNNGGRFNPTTSSWAPVTTTDAPTPRNAHTAIWTGTEMIVWGGRAGSNGPYNNGARYNPANDSWTPVTTVGASVARAFHTAVWTGSEMIVWGGFDGVNTLSSGARYNPSNDSWSAVSSTGAPTASSSHLAIWTGNEMIIWGGSANGCRYNPTTNTWAALSTNGAPSIRSDASAIWTGTEMIVWGGNNGASFNDGYRYNPLADTWTAISTTNAPSARYNHTAVWTGTEMIIYGGSDGNGVARRYSPLTDSWSLVGTSDNRNNHTAIWTEREMIVWGGGVNGNFNTNTLRYTPGRVLHLYQRP